MTWFVMRDLSRPNALHPAYLRLQNAGFRVYTPMVYKLVGRGKSKVRALRPALHDLLFVDSERALLDPLVEEIPTLQYRFRRGGVAIPMVIDPVEMDRFITATSGSADIIYYTPGEVSSQMVGREVEILDGPLAGFTGKLLSVKGMRKRRLLVEIKDFITAAVEVNPDFIKFI